MNSAKLVMFFRESGLAKLIPKGIKKWVRSSGMSALHHSEWQKSREVTLSRARVSPPVTDKQVCIIHEWGLRHSYYEAACRELGVPYTVLDVTDPDWMAEARNDPGVVFFFRPFVITSFGRALYEERAFFLEQVLHKNLFPRYAAIWPYESKRRCAMLLEASGIPHPRTWSFFSAAQAMRFLADASYPLVFKTDLGAEAYGVRILFSRKEGAAMVRRCFGRGVRCSVYDPRDRNRGQALFQEYLRDVREWRVIRIGDSYFAYEKGKEGHFHSGSKITLFGAPPHGLLEFSRNALDKMGLDCVSLDVFVGADMSFHVNEIQSYYGATESNAICYEDGQPVTLAAGQTVEMMIQGRIGRYLWCGDRWTFEEGDFARNAGCNLRVKMAFQRMGCPLPGYRV